MLGLGKQSINVGAALIARERKLGDLMARSREGNATKCYSESVHLRPQIRDEGQSVIRQGDPPTCGRRSVQSQPLNQKPNVVRCGLATAAHR